MTKTFITHEDGSDENWVCICKNRPDSDGFFPCDENGNEIEPIIGSGWEALYVCGKCGRIINQFTLEVVGQNPNPKRLV